jgi:hypothetical protein
MSWLYLVIFSICLVDFYFLIVEVDPAPSSPSHHDLLLFPALTMMHPVSSLPDMKTALSLARQLYEVQGQDITTMPPESGDLTLGTSLKKKNNA